MKKFVTAAAKNWRTTIAGVVAFISGCPPIFTAISDWAKGHHVSWHAVGAGFVMWVIGGGLVAAKDAQTHSTPQEVQAAQPRV